MAWNASNLVVHVLLARIIFQKRVIACPAIVVFALVAIKPIEKIVDAVFLTAKAINVSQFTVI